MRSAQAGGGQEARAIGRMRARRTGSKRTIHYTPLEAARTVPALQYAAGVCTRYARSATRRPASMRTVLA